ncbi:MAG: Nramp family divalent metal transporter [Bacteroidota bacterium]
MSLLSKYFGPSTLVTAAFLGPGTLTVCTLAGVRFGYSLLWVLLFAIVSTIILQEMAARIGVVTQKGLGEAIRTNIQHPLIRKTSLMLIFTAIVLGNAAYEAGNIAGATLGLQMLQADFSYWPLLVGGAAFTILYLGTRKAIEKTLIGLVVIMSLIFVITALLVKPDLTAVAAGFLPQVAATDFLTVVGLLGTTIVPYNLFLHASTISSKYEHPEQMNAVRFENSIAILLGGLISMAILITSATVLHGQNVSGLEDMAAQLEPLLGKFSKPFLGIGFFAAGVSSAMTAPIAAAYAASGIFSWSPSSSDWRFRGTWILILFIGTVFASLGYKPIKVIQIAQVANGMLLPLIAFFLIYSCNQKRVLGQYTNTLLQNCLSILVLLITIAIGFRGISKVVSTLSW